jgi:hypothetical protein
MSAIEQRLSGLGLQLPAPLQPPPGVVLPWNIPVEIEAEVELKAQ